MSDPTPNPAMSQALDRLHTALALFICEATQASHTPAQIMDLMHAIDTRRQCLRFMAELSADSLSVTAHAHEIESGSAFELLNVAGPVTPSPTPAHPPENRGEQLLQLQSPRERLSETLIAASLGLATLHLQREPQDVREAINQELERGDASISACINADCKGSRIQGRLLRRREGGHVEQFPLFEFEVIPPSPGLTH